jgi:hypothetical protein
MITCPHGLVKGARCLTLNLTVSGRKSHIKIQPWETNILTSSGVKMRSTMKE